MASGASAPRRAAGASQPVAEVLARCLEALSHRPNALVCDIDGTISRIVPRPEDATVSPRVTEALENLVGALDLVAVITARQAALARRMVGADGVEYVGNYGLPAGADVHGADSIKAARRVVLPLLAGLPCVTVEDKGVAFSLHYRNCDQPEAVRERLLSLAAPVAEATGTRLLEGKRVIEFVPGALPDKHSAFLALTEARGIRGLVYLGDDLSDIPVFGEIKGRRAEGVMDAVAVVVRDNETDPSVAEAADLAVEGVDAVEELLGALARELSRSGG
ncbi:MAG TPA: trehalose-phosphatase [Dehalococcoidia bacterium]|nr:trehalose-phosphatase [Dehalococcoidia bacterium]